MLPSFSTELASISLLSWFAHPVVSHPVPPSAAFGALLASHLYLWVEYDSVSCLCCLNCLGLPRSFFHLHLSKSYPGYCLILSHVLIETGISNISLWVFFLLSCWFLYMLPFFSPVDARDFSHKSIHSTLCIRYSPNALEVYSFVNYNLLFQSHSEWEHDRLYGSGLQTRLAYVVFASSIQIMSIFRKDFTIILSILALSQTL